MSDHVIAEGVLENGYSYKIIEIDPTQRYKSEVFSPEGEKIPYEFKFRDASSFIEENVLWITSISNDDESKRHRGKGIAPALICEVPKILKKRLYSSSKEHPERRHEAATKVWEKLKKEGKAGYNGMIDRYYTL